MKLNLFCGTDYQKGFVNVDAISAFQPDLVHDLRKPLPYITESIDEIRIVDGLEHLNCIDAEKMMVHWISLLKPNGKMHIRVPDWDLVDKNNLAQVFGELDWKGIPTGDYGCHRWAYTRHSINEWLEKLGLRVLLLKNDLGNLIVEARKGS